MKTVNRYVVLTVLLKIVFGIPLIIAGIIFQIEVLSYRKLLISIIAITLFLSFIYYIYQWYRLNRAIQKEDIESLYKAPIISAIHTALDFIILTPILFFIFNLLLSIVPMARFFKITAITLSVGFIEFGLVYSIGYLVLVPCYKSIKGVRFKGQSLTWKLLFTFVPSILFAIYNGSILAKTLFGHLYFIPPALLIYALIRMIKEPVESLNEGFDQFLSENPDLSQRVIIVSGDELEELSVKFNSFLEIVSGIIENINASALKVVNQAKSLFTAVEKTTTFSERINNSIEVINKNSQDSKGRIEEIHHHTEELTSITSEIESQMQVLKNFAKKSVELANSGEEKAEEALLMNQAYVEKMKESSSHLESLRTSFKEVEKFTAMMESISNDTNLLALNASIEASRVGEESKGFTVIAEEIRKLSSDSASHLEKMRKAIDIMNVSVQSVEKSNEESKMISIKSNESVQKTQDNLTDISESIALTMNMVEQVTLILLEEMKTIQGITDSITLLSDFLNKNAESTKMISEDTDNQMISMKETQSLTEKLSELSERMTESIEHYID